MSIIRADSIKNRGGNGAPDFPNGLTVTGIVTATVLDNNITGDLTVSGNLGVGGTVTYEDVTNVDSVGVVTARSGVHVGPTAGVGATIYTDGGARFSGIVTATGGVVGNVTGSASSIDVANGSSNSTYYPVFTDNNGSAKTLSIDSGGSLQYNPSTNVLTAGTLKGKGTVEVHSYSLDSAGDVGSNSNFFSFSMTPSIDWNKCIWAHSGAHRAGSDTYYYAGYQFNKGGGDVDQHMRGMSRAQSGTTHNQGWCATGTAMESNGTFMTGSANVGCTFKCHSSSGANSAPANDSGHDHHAWVMFIHD